MHPTFLHIGFLTIPTFGILAAAGLMLALTLSLRTALAVGLRPERLWNAGLFAIIAAFVLSRLLLVATNLHTFFSYPILLLMVPSLTPLGLLLTVVVTAIYLRVSQLPLLATLDAWAPCATLAWSFLALGHFAEGSDPGLPSTLPWAMPNVPGSPFRLHPVALYVSSHRSSHHYHPAPPSSPHPRPLEAPLLSPSHSAGLLNSSSPFSASPSLKTTPSALSLTPSSGLHSV